MKFFIPDLKDDPAAAEERWAHYLAESPNSPAGRRVYSVTYEHGGDRYVATVGECRKVYKRRTGPRGGYIKYTDHVGWAAETGAEISAIIDDRKASRQIHVWSYGPPFRGWANPSIVGDAEVRSIEYFDEPGS